MCIPTAYLDKHMPNSNRYFVQRNNKLSSLRATNCNSNRYAFNYLKFSRSHDSMVVSYTNVSLFLNFQLFIKTYVYLNLWQFHHLTCNPGGLSKLLCLLGDNVIVASYFVLVSDASKSEFCNRHFEQSSNQVHIECVFSMLVNK